MDLSNFKSLVPFTGDREQRGDAPPIQGGSCEVKKQFVLATRPPMPSVEKLQEMAEARGIKWDAALAERAVPYWASDERVDWHGDIVIQNWDFKTFERNPVLAWNHQHHKAPIGSVLDWAVVERKTSDYDGPALYLLNLFAPDGDLPFDGSLFNLVKSGFLKGGSVGFKSHKIIDVRDEDERHELGLGKWGVILDKNELFEFSPTTLGANSGAVALMAEAKEKGTLTAADIAVLRELKRQEFLAAEKGDEEFLEEDQAMVMFSHKIFPGHEPVSVSSVYQPVLTTWITGTSASTEEPGRPLRNYVPGITIRKNPLEGAEAVAVLEKQGETLTDLLSRVGSLELCMRGIDQKLSDIRELLEDTEAGVTASEPEPQPKSQGPLDGVPIELLSSTLAKWAEMRTSTNATPTKESQR